jgi:Membrane protein of unknown function (DUF340).
MFVIIACMLAGVAIGYLLRRHKIRFIHKLILGLIWALLFSLGLEIGVNEAVVSRFGTLGFEALLLAVGGTLGSVIAAWLLWLAVRNKSVSQ